MIVNVEMWAFADGKIREVDISNDKVSGNIDDLLDYVFYFGQNDFQPKEFPSVSVGDVILLPTYGGQERPFLVKGVGFEELHPDVFENYKAMPDNERRTRAMNDDPEARRVVEEANKVLLDCFPKKFRMTPARAFKPLKNRHYRVSKEEGGERWLVEWRETPSINHAIRCDFVMQVHLVTKLLEEAGYWEEGN